MRSCQPVVPAASVSSKTACHVSPSSALANQAARGRVEEVRRVTELFGSDLGSFELFDRKLPFDIDGQDPASISLWLSAAVSSQP